MQGVDALIFNDGFGAGGVWTRTAGAYRIATHLRNMGLRVQVIDFWSYLTLESPDLMELLINKFVGSSTLFVGFSTTFLNWRLSEYVNQQVPVSPGKSYYSKQITNEVLACPEDVVANVRRLVKDRNPKTTLLLGGARANAYTKHIDVAVYGYGERHIQDYVLWRQGKYPFFQYRMEHQVMVLDYDVKADGYDFEHSFIRWVPEDCVEQGEVLPIEVSRGCIFRCKFCSFPLNGRSKLDYLKDEGIMHDEFVRNYELWGTTRYVFADDTYNDTVDKLEWMQRIRDRLPFNLEFATYGRLDLIAAHPEMAALIKANGCTSITFGIESMNQKAAAAIGKGAATEKLVETLYRLRESEWGNDIHTSSGFILGLPHDTEATMDKWVERVIDPRFPLHTVLFIPLGIAGSDTPKRFRSVFDEEPQKYGYQLGPAGWVNPVYGTTHARCEKLAFSLFDYAYHTGRSLPASHVLIGIEGPEFDRQTAIGMGLKGLDLHYNMLHRTNARYIRYLHSVFALPS